MISRSVIYYLTLASIFTLLTQRSFGQQFKRFGPKQKNSAPTSPLKKFKKKGEIEPVSSDAPTASFQPSIFPSLSSSPTFSNKTPKQPVGSDLSTATPSISFGPSIDPSSEPSYVPTTSPTYKPSNRPTISPSTFEPSTCQPSQDPTKCPSYLPTISPSSNPSHKPSSPPTIFPSFKPTTRPTRYPSNFPTTKPTKTPTTSSPSFSPSRKPSKAPTFVPSTETPTTEQPTAPPPIVVGFSSSLQMDKVSSPEDFGTSSYNAIAMTLSTILNTDVSNIVVTAVFINTGNNTGTNSSAGAATSKPTAMQTSHSLAVDNHESGGKVTRKHPETSLKDYSVSIIVSVKVCAPGDSNPNTVYNNVLGDLGDSISSGAFGDALSKSAMGLGASPILGGTVKGVTPTEPFALTPLALAICPTEAPTFGPTAKPSRFPTFIPTDVPTFKPSHMPTDMPTFKPSNIPTELPSHVPTEVPSDEPTESVVRRTGLDQVQPEEGDAIRGYLSEKGFFATAVTGKVYIKNLSPDVMPMHDLQASDSKQSVKKRANARKSWSDFVEIPDTIDITTEEKISNTQSPTDIHSLDKEPLSSVINERLEPILSGEAEVESEVSEDTGRERSSEVWHHFVALSDLHTVASEEKNAPEEETSASDTSHNENGTSDENIRKENSHSLERITSTVLRS